MSLADRLLADLRDAMRQHDTVVRETLRMARSAIQYAEIELKRTATDQEVMDILAREIKRRKEAIDLYRQGKREDLVAAEEAQLQVLERYLPQQLSRDEIAVELGAIVTELGLTSVSQLGQLMRVAMPRLKGRADGSLVNQVAREILS
ncbi:MAG: GatB/YqeY domain-containing protein [Chloroflexi bacterium]|jgi:uncharacterized protein YqeY|nr:GatB/YqeY domain-containing protein [Chloroflexota bacterium]